MGGQFGLVERTRDRREVEVPGVRLIGVHRWRKKGVGVGGEEGERERRGRERSRGRVPFEEIRPKGVDFHSRFEKSR